jgi:hypothetical protein
MTSSKQVFIAALFLLVSVPAGAQMGMGRGQMPKGVFNPEVGSGAVYEMQGTQGRKTEMEYAIVGKDSVDGKEGYWLEMTMSGGPMGEMVMKALNVVSDGKLVTSKIVMQMEGRPPMEIPAQMKRMSGQTESADIRLSAEDLGVETITTPAGTFSCHHYRMKDGSGDSWVSEKAPPFGMVKFQGKGTSMVLTKLITNAKDKITGTPQPLNPMMMQHSPQQ